MKALSFRCAAKTEPGQFRTISVLWPGPSVRCNCDASAGEICSHIDATLVAGERAMVPEADRAMADEAMKAIAGRIVVPSYWKASWRKNLRWRGLSQRSRAGHSGKPLVCFTGAMPKSRKLLFEEAHSAGWETVDAPNSQIDVVVAADPQGSSNKLKFAREHGIPILSFEEWGELTPDGELLTT